MSEEYQENRHQGRRAVLTGAAFSDAEIDEFTRTYQRPQVLTGGFELYRTLEQDERDNAAAAPITMPTMLMTAEGCSRSPGPRSNR